MSSSINISANNNEGSDNNKDVNDDSILYTKPSKDIIILNNQQQQQQYDDEEHENDSIPNENVFNQQGEKETLPPLDSLVVNTDSDNDQNIVCNNQLVNFSPENNSLQVVSAETLDNGTSTIYLLVSNESSNTVLPITQNQISEQNVAGVNFVTDEDNTFKSIDNNISQIITSGTTSVQDGTIVQVMNSNGVPVNLNVNDLLNSLTHSRGNTLKKDSIPGILSLSNSIISTTENVSVSTEDNSENKSHIDAQQNINDHFIFDSPINQAASVPSWALHLRDCTLCGDTYTGFVTNDNEMDAILNLYKKETQSLFAIRQTPSPAKDESADTVRLMWKSQYVPYDGIPFVNVGRRATVMECEYGPRKRSNALKRMAQMHSHKNGLKKIPNLTCPARLFVKKVRKFPQFRVPLEADAKVVRTLQEQSLKLVRQAGIHAGEIRLYMQLPLPSAHRYHHIGNSMELFQKELDNLDDVLLDSMSVDGRVLEKIQEIVRQGYSNPFLVRSAAKDFVENNMQLNVNEARPYKHNKAFYPALIEIQNIIQQTEAAMNSGVLTSLPKPDIPLTSVRPKRKRSSAMGTPQSSPLLIKRVKVDIPADEAALNDRKHLNLGPSKQTSDISETIALTLTDNQLENFSVTNFTYDQLAQLAKIGLIALNNATKEDSVESDQTSTTECKLNETEGHQTISMTDGESILVVTPNNANEEKARLRILTGTLESPDIAVEEAASSTNVEQCDEP